MEKAFPMNAVLVDGVPDRVYAAEDFAAERAAYVSNGVTAPLALAVTAAGGRTLTVAPGAACVNGYTYQNTAPLSLTLPEGETASTHRVVLRLDLSARERKVALLSEEGTAVPSLTEGETVFEIPLSRVAVPEGTAEITAEMLTDERPRADYILNPIEVEAALARYEAALSEYFDGADAAAIVAASQVLRTDGAAEDVLCGDGVYRALPDSATPLVELCRFTESGTFVPADYPAKDSFYTVVLQGAGGSGGRGTGCYGGQSGGYTVVQAILTGESYPVTVGVGGEARYGISANSAGRGNDGGETSFGPFTVPGGAGGYNSKASALTVGVYTASAGTNGVNGTGGDSLFGAGGANSNTGNGYPGGLGAGGGAGLYSSASYSGAGGDGVVIVLGCAP